VSFFGGLDGSGLECPPVIDGSGNLYGTATSDGSYGGGVAWEITP